MAKRILIIDDDARNIFAISAVLRSRKYDCISATSAGKALEILKAEQEIDAILLDMMMPEMDGYEAIPLIRKIPFRNAVPVVAVTAQAMIGDREKCLNAGADEYLAKPVNVDKLFEILERFQDGRPTT